MSNQIEKDVKELSAILERIPDLLKSLDEPIKKAVRFFMGEMSHSTIWGENYYNNLEADLDLSASCSKWLHFTWAQFWDSYPSPDRGNFFLPIESLFDYEKLQEFTFSEKEKWEKKAREEEKREE